LRGSGKKLFLLNGGSAKCRTAAQNPLQIFVQGDLLEETIMSKLKLICAAAALCGGVLATPVSAMPIAPLPSDGLTNVENVRWVCGPYRCWWRPNYYSGGYGAYGYYPRPYRSWRYRHWRRW
jgi:hypothetical protein